MDKDKLKKLVEMLRFDFNAYKEAMSTDEKEIAEINLRKSVEKLEAFAGC